MSPMLHAHHKTVALRLTPLSPIHIGCGIDFDPTGYVIDEGLLFHFDPAQVVLSDADKRALLAAVNRPASEAILAVQRFFNERRSACIGAARQVLPVAAGIAAQHHKRVGQVAQTETRGAKVANTLEIERTSHHPHSGMAYLPGSSIKGAMRTAWLDQLNQGRARRGPESANQLEQRLLDRGSFETDPFRLLRVSDAQGAAVASQVVFSTNQKKRQVFRDGLEQPGRGPTTRREVMVGAQFAALQTEVVVDTLLGRHDPGSTPAPAGRIGNWQQLAAACHRYYLPRLTKELNLLEDRRLANPAWVAAMRQLLDALKPVMASGDAVLLRVGRHSGAESVTLDGVRDIKIMKGPKESAGYSSEGATTVWLAAHEEKARSGMQPFGWLLLHREGVELPALAQWCAAQPKPDTHAAYARLSQARESAQRQAAEAAADKARRQALLRAADLVAEQQAQRLQALSDEGRAVADLACRLQAHTAAKKQPISAALWPAVAKLIAAADSWADAADRAALADLLAGPVPEKIELGGKAKDVKHALARLRNAGAPP